MRFRDDVARTNAAHEGIDMICVRGYLARSHSEGLHENTAQIALNRLAAVCRVCIGAVKKAATRANIGGASGKTFQRRNCKGNDDASTSCKSKTISSCAVAARKVATQQSCF